MILGTRVLEQPSWDSYDFRILDCGCGGRHPAISNHGGPGQDLAGAESQNADGHTTGNAHVESDQPLGDDQQAVERLVLAKQDGPAAMALRQRDCGKMRNLTVAQAL